MEAAAFGNVLVQARALGVVDGDRWAMRDLTPDYAANPALSAHGRFTCVGRRRRSHRAVGPGTAKRPPSGLICRAHRKRPRPRTTAPEAVARVWIYRSGADSTSRTYARSAVSAFPVCAFTWLG